jgi:multiple sugar transport system substrate-binding protein
MLEALAFYKELYQYTMPGSNDATSIRDAFLNGSAPMAIYSTYILAPLASAGIIADAGIAIPANKTKASFGNIGTLTINADLDEAERDATIKFVSFVIGDEGNARWLHMAPGGQQPLFESVARSQAYLDNDTIRSFSHIAQDIAGAFRDIQVFGVVDGKNFLSMGDISSSGIIGRAINALTVGGQSPEAIAKNTQAEIEALLK